MDLAVLASPVHELTDDVLKTALVGGNEKVVGIDENCHSG